MHRHKDAERTAHYRQEASACATAALSTAIAEIKQAYLDLEKGWLCLVPKVEGGPTAADDLTIAFDADSKPKNRTRHDNAAHEATAPGNL